MGAGRLGLGARAADIDERLGWVEPEHALRPLWPVRLEERHRAVDRHRMVQQILLRPHEVEARRVEASRGASRRDEARRGEERRGEARRVEARRGESSRGEASPVQPSQVEPNQVQCRQVPPRPRDTPRETPTVWVTGAGGSLSAGTWEAAWGEAEEFQSSQVKAWLRG